MERQRTSPAERRKLEAQAAGITAVRQAIAVYLVNHGISQDVSWQLATGQLELEHEAVESLNLADEIFQSLDDARYMIEARTATPTVVGTYDPDEEPAIDALDDPERLVDGIGPLLEEGAL